MKELIEFLKEKSYQIIIIQTFVVLLSSKINHSLAYKSFKLLKAIYHNISRTYNNLLIKNILVVIIN